MTSPKLKSKLQFIPVYHDHDIQSVARLASTIWNEYYHDLLGQEQIDYMLETLQSQESISDAIKTHDLEYFLVYVNNINIAYLALGVEDGALLLSKCYLLKEYRGQGYFKELLSFVEQEALKKSYDTIHLYVNKYNNTLSIYEHQGFKVIGSYKFDIGQGYIMDDFKMSKLIERGNDNGNE